MAGAGAWQVQVRGRCRCVANAGSWQVQVLARGMCRQGIWTKGGRRSANFM